MFKQCSNIKTTLKKTYFVKKLTNISTLDELVCLYFFNTPNEPNQFFIGRCKDFLEGRISCCKQRSYVIKQTQFYRFIAFFEEQTTTTNKLGHTKIGIKNAY
jgi:hypothetical protein